MKTHGHKSRIVKFIDLQHTVLCGCRFFPILLLIVSAYLIFYVTAKMLEAYWLYRFSHQFCITGSIAIVVFYVLFGYPWLIYQKTSAQVPHEFGFAYRYGGGIKGYLKGTQRLASAFWLINVGSIIVLMALSCLATELILKSNSLKADFIFRLIFYSLIMARFFFVSISIIRCRKNTSYKVFSYLALFYVAIELLHKIYVLPGAFISLYRTFLEI